MWHYSRCTRAVGRDTLADAGSPESALDTFVGAASQPRAAHARHTPLLLTLPASTPRSPHPELIGAFWDDNGFGRGSSLSGELQSASAKTVGGQLYYVYETASHNLISANVADGQLYLLTVSAGNERQWRSSEAVLRRIVGSFAVPA